MNGTHVAKLTYKLATDRTVLEYDSPSPLGRSYSEFDLTLADGSLTVVPKVHFATEAEARNQIEPFLRAWEIDQNLRTPLGFKFAFQESTIVDLDPPAFSLNRVMHVSAGIFATAAVDARIKITRKSYPAPPARFKVTADVETLLHRLTRYRLGKEPVASMGYFCLTLFLNIGRVSRRKAAKKYAIDPAVLSELGRITTLAGDASEARKMSSGATLVPLTDRDRDWIEAVVVALIARLGEYEADPGAPMKHLTLTDFPPPPAAPETP